MEGEASSSRACAPPHRLSPEEVKRLLKICHGGLTTAQILENMSGEFRMESDSDATDSDNDEIYDRTAINRDRSEEKADNDPAIVEAMDT